MNERTTMKKPRTFSTGEVFQLNKSELLTFYDLRQLADKERGSPVTAITSLIGEDLVLGLLEHYLRTDGKDALLGDPIYKCKTRGKTGPQLDAWILTKKHLYQTEVKNWCASAIGGVEVGQELSGETAGGRKRRKPTLIEAATRNRERYLSHKDTAKKVWKVLATMNRPLPWSSKHPKPLLAFWSPMAPWGAKTNDDLEAFFPLATKHFRKTIAETGLLLQTPYAATVWIFSASNYLRLRKNNAPLRVRLPRVAQRLEKLRKLGIKLV
jgi:hypothetical protein